MNLLLIISAVLARTKCVPWSDIMCCVELGPENEKRCGFTVPIECVKEQFKKGTQDCCIVFGRQICWHPPTRDFTCKDKVCE